jgi:hypothetical protein
MATAILDMIEQDKIRGGIFDRMRVKYENNDELVQSLFRSGKNGNKGEFVELLRQFGDRAGYVSEMGHNLGAKPAK